MRLLAHLLHVDLASLRKGIFFGQTIVFFIGFIPFCNVERQAKYEDEQIRSSGSRESLVEIQSKKCSFWGMEFVENLKFLADHRIGPYKWTYRAFVDDVGFSALTK